MAKAPVHKLGQMIGDFIEKRFSNELKEICEDRSLYLDVDGTHRKVTSSKKVTWYDAYGSKHDLDFVIERDGTEECIGTPVAFVECAWRRYTKHSKNKAQEIQGAILPVAEKYYDYKPFLGAVIAGEFTLPSIEQLKLSGFEVIHFSYSDVVSAFSDYGLDVGYDESTPDVDAENKVSNFETFDEKKLQLIFDRILELNAAEVRVFQDSLIETLDRYISQIIIAPMFGSYHSFSSVDEALNFLSDDAYSKPHEKTNFVELYVQIEYSNGDKIEGRFKKPSYARKFISGNT